MSAVLILVIGLILRFAVTWSVAGIDLQVIGDILIGAGILLLIWILFSGSDPIRRIR